MRLDLPVPGCESDLVHPLRSRRLGGLGAGVDLNPDASCNWRCVYCDVPGIHDAKGPEVDVERLGADLRRLLEVLRDGAWAREHVPEADPEPRGVLISGRGEPTLSFQFAPAVEAVAEAVGDSQLPVALVTNGSNVNSRKVRTGLERLAELGGEVWFKFDAATREGLRALNRSDSILRQVRENMRVAGTLCPTRVQTTVATVDGTPSLDDKGVAEYLSFLSLQLRARVPLAGVQLLALDRPSEQAAAGPDAPAVELSPPRDGWLEELAERIRTLDLEVHVYP